MSTTKMDLASISGSAKGLVKGVAVVDVVAESAEPLRAAEITERTGLPHSTAMRLLDVLTRTGLLRVDPSGLYELGPHVAAWGVAFQRSFDLARQARDLMDALKEETQETVFLGVLDRGSVRYAAVAPSPHAVRPAATIGDRNPLYCTGIGKAMLAHLPTQEREPILAGPLQRRTENTLTERSALEADLARIRERGFAIDDVENEASVRCVAAPVRGQHGQVVAAMSVSAPDYRFSLDDALALGPRVLAAAAELSARAGHRPGDPDQEGHGS